MNVRRRIQEGGGGHAIGLPPKNAASSHRESATQAKAIKNAHNKPSSVGVNAVRNAVSRNSK